MELQINELLNNANALPNQENWEMVDPEFKNLYHGFIQEISGQTELTAEQKELQKNLISKFYELHEIEEEPVNENIETDEDMKKKKNTRNTHNTEAEEVLKKINEPVNETFETVVAEEKPEIMVKEEGGVIEQPAAEIVAPVQQVQQSDNNPFAEFLNFAQTVETISAKDLVKYKVPEGYWKENKPEFRLGNILFKKTVSSLIFNRWQVVKV